ncbi:hypothetical protein KR059_002131, partial [Drosophila kikkawai]
MDLEDLTAVMKLCDDNVHKLQDSLTSYQREVDHVRQVLAERWANVEKVDGRLISLHDHLLSSLSEVNAYVIKMNLYIKLNRPGGGMLPESEKPAEPPYRRDSVKLSGISAIKESGDQHKKDEQPIRPSVQQQPSEDSTQQLVPIDLSSTQKLAAVEVPPNGPNSLSNQVSESLVFSMHSSWVIEPTPENLKPNPKAVQQAPFQEITTSTPEKPTSESMPIQPAPPLPPAKLPKFPMTPRKRPLLPPKSGTQTSSDGIYEQIFKNIAAFPENTVVSATVMHLNMATNCFYVAKWDEDSKPLGKLLKGLVPLRELDQMPDYGDIFAVNDCIDHIIPRVIVNARVGEGGYDAYLIDYGEHLHLSGNENIFALPDAIKQLPAQAIRCHLANCKVSNINNYSYNTVKLRILYNNGIDIVANLIDEEKSLGQEKPRDKPDDTGKIPAEKPTPARLSEADMAMLNEIGPSTSDPLKAVLGFRPTDEQRICRHYDPKINGCFKGNNCRLIHEPFAPLGATKDVEVAAALPEAVFDTLEQYKMGSTVRMLITFVNSPIEVYAQFVDDRMPPLVWASKDVPDHKRTFKQKPKILDIVLAYYSDDCYYRAQIMDELDGNYKIFYVDYGNTEFVYIESLAPCDDVDRRKPYRAISCHIEGVIRMPDLCHQKTAECVEFLKSKLQNTEMDVVLRHRLPDGVLVGFTGEYADVPRQLLQRGYAQPSD